MRRFWILAMVCGMAACDDAGQSGSEVMHPSGAPPVDEPPTSVPGLPPQPHCPCDGLRQMQPIRAKIVSTQAFPAVSTVRYELVVEQLLGPDPFARNELAVGDHFGGYWNGQLACGGSIELAVGAEVLAFHRRGRQDGVECCDYIACSDPCRALPSAQDDQSPTSEFGRCDAACETSTHDACAQHQQEALLHGELMLTPWADALLVGESEGRQVSIRVDQLGALQREREACIQELPDLWPMLRPQVAEATPSNEQIADAAHDAGMSLVAQPPPSTLARPPSTPLPPVPSTSALPPSGGPTLPSAVNTASVAPEGPPAGPEEIRVRCAAK
jgi:hypothetical protein